MHQMEHLPVASFIIVFITFICHLIDRKYKLPSEHINFSGECVLQNKYYVLFTFGLFHGNASHLVQQLTLLIPLSITLEYKIGAIYLLLSYFVCGIFGTVITWRIDRIYYSKLYPTTGEALADCIWSRGSSGHVYGICGLSSILCSNEYLFQHYDIQHFGFIWMLIANLLFHLFHSKSYFIHNPYPSYAILITLCSILLYFGPHKVTVNQYLCIYFIHLGIWRLYPRTFNVSADNFIASDYKSHLIGATFGVMFGIFAPYIIADYKGEYSILPYVCILIADGLCGQYMVHRRIQFNLAKMKAQKHKK
eukprot:205106_1